MSRVQVNTQPEQTHFHAGTPLTVRRVLERARKTDSLIRVFYGDTKTGRDWAEENDTIGYVGRSTGIQKIPLLIERLRSGNGLTRACGGGGILDHCVVRIMDVASKKDLYRHALYACPRFELAQVADTTLWKRGLRFELHRDGTCWARFRTLEATCSYLAFIVGEIAECGDPRALADYYNDHREAA